MNALPEYRRAIHGRTHGRTYRHADYDPIERYAVDDSSRIALAAIAIVSAICGAALFVHFWIA